MFSHSTKRILSNKFFKIAAFFVFILILFVYQIFALVKNRAKSLDDQQITTLVQRVSFSSEQNFSKILSKDKRTFSFKAENNNLGIIAVLINNYDQVNSDQLTFRIREKTSDNWYFQEKYTTSKMNASYFYTFGFPLIAESKGKEYLVEIESIAGVPNNSISLHSDSRFFMAKYSYPKSYLFDHSDEIVPFTIKRIEGYREYLSKADVFALFLKTLGWTAVVGIIFYISKKYFLEIIAGYLNSIYARKNELAEYLKDYVGSKSFKSELLFVLTPVMALLDFAFFSPFTKEIGIPLLVIISLLNIGYLYLIYVSFNAILSFVRDKIYYPIAFPVVVFVVSRLFFLDAVPRWDSAVYFHALLKSMAKFDYSIGSFLGFNWFGHPSMGFGLYSSIFQFLKPDSILMVNIGNIFLGIIAIISFYLISLYFFENRKKIELVLLTTMFAINPLFFSVSTAFLPDFGVIVFFLAALAAFFNKKHLLTTFFFLLMVFSKETGVYTYGFFLLFISIFVLLQRLSKIHPEKIISFFFALIPGLSFLLYFIHSKGRHWTAGKPIVISNDCFFCFSFQPAHFIQNIEVMFILNFSWILSVIIIISLILHFFKRQQFSSFSSAVKKQEFKSLVATFVSFVVFFMVFVIYIIPSYMTISVVFLLFIAYFSLLQLKINSGFRILILLFVTTIFLIQSFFNIDWLSSKIFGEFSLGNHQVVKVGSEYSCDGLIYNTQYLYIDRLITKFHQEFGISESDSIILNASHWHSFYLGGGGYEVYIDPNTLQKTFMKTNGFRPQIYPLKAAKTYPDEAYYLAFPWLEDEGSSLEILKGFYSIDKETRITTGGYWITVYSLSKK